VAAPPERTAEHARRGERFRAGADEHNSDSGDGKQETVGRVSGEERGSGESGEERRGDGEEGGGEGEESGGDGGDDGDEEPGNGKKAAGHGGENSEGMVEEVEARAEDKAREEAAAKGKGRLSNGSREGAKPARPPSVEAPPSGKLIVTPHKSPRHGGARERKRKLSSELPSSSDKRRKSEDGAEGGKKKKNRYKPVESSALCSYFDKETMDRIGRRFTLMLIMRDGVEIQRRSNHRILNMGQLVLAAEDIVDPLEAENFERAIRQSFALNTDQ
jgi:ribonuclease E